MNSSRRRFFQQSLATITLSSFAAKDAAANPFHCTPAPEFPVPLTAGIWRSAPFPVGRHAYNISLIVDRRLPLEQLDCELGPPRPHEQCAAPPLLDVEWKIWDGDLPIRSFPEKPIQASAWATTETSCLLGGFEGRRNGMFTLEWNVKRDAGPLKELHPRVQIVKNPGYWCWL